MIGSSERARPPRAVVLDLFGTLVPAGSRDERDRVSREVAACLGVEPRAFAAEVRRTFDARTRGLLGDLPSTLRSLARGLDGDPSDAAVADAVALRLEMTRSLLERTWAVPVLEALAARGIGRGVVSDCSAETPAVWGSGPLAAHVDATSFSCVTGRRKPDAEAYEVVLRELDVPAGECWYVGDGGSHELSGARALGMHAVRLAPQDDDADPVDADVEWFGPVLSRLDDLVARLD